MTTVQIVGMFGIQDVQYEYALSHATASHDHIILDALRQMGRTLDSYSRFQTRCRNQFWPPDNIAALNRMKAVLVVSPSLSIAEVYGWTKGLRTGEKELNTMLMTMEDLRKTDTAFSVPVFFIQGEGGNVTPTSLVADYISKIQAPAKKLDIVPGARLFCDVDTPQRVPQFLERRRTICLDKAWRCELTNEPNNAVRSTHG